MFRISSAITNKLKDTLVPGEIEKSTSTPSFTSKDDPNSEFSDTVSEPDLYQVTEIPVPDFQQSPFKLKEKSKSTRRRRKSMQVPTPIRAASVETFPSHERSPTILESLERPVALSPRLRAHFQNLSITGESEQPFAISFEDVAAAAFRIKKGISKTPCEKANIPELQDIEIYFKKEFSQTTGSFKERGARNTLLLLTKEQKQIGVIAASAGNHALALAYHGQALNVPVTVVMPENCTIVKEMKCRNYGATVLHKGKNLAEAKEFAVSLGKEKGLMYVNGYNHPHILAGQGTMGLEILEQVEDVDAIIVPVGGGGLIAGVAVAVKSLYPHCQIIGVESEMCPSFKAALDAGKPVRIDTHHALTLADGLCVPKVGKNAFEIAKSYVDKTVIVSENYIGIAVLRLIEHERVIVEGSGAAGLAALLAGLLPELKGKRVVIPLCGGNIDPTVLGRCIERGLSSEGRLCRFVVNVHDRPGGIAELTQLIASIGVSIKDLYHERAWMTSGIFSVQLFMSAFVGIKAANKLNNQPYIYGYLLQKIKIIAEVRNREHGLELRSLLSRHYEDVMWNTDHTSTYTPS